MISLLLLISSALAASPSPSPLRTSNPFEIVYEPSPAVELSFSDTIQIVGKKGDTLLLVNGKGEVILRGRVIAKDSELGSTLTELIQEQNEWLHRH